MLRLQKDMCINSILLFSSEAYCKSLRYTVKNGTLRKNKHFFQYTVLKHKILHRREMIFFYEGNDHFQRLISR